MSVIKSNRNLSRYEYEYSFGTTYEHMMGELNRVPNRRHKSLCDPIFLILTDIFNRIMELRTGYYTKSERENINYEIIKNALNKIYSLQVHFYTFWNIMESDTKKMKYWCELFNNNINLLYGMLVKNKNYNEMDIKHMLHYYKKEDLKNVDFIRCISKLHKYTHGKIINSQSKYNYCALLENNINHLLFYCIEANHIYPKTKNDYERRKKYISSAISCFHKMQPSIASYFSIQNCSEATMKEWSELFNNAYKCLQALRKSDTKRFANLK